MTQKERETKDPVNRMTQATHTRLLAEKAAAEQKATELERSLGSMFDNAADWHDNAAFDHAKQDMNLIHQSINGLTLRLRDVEYITPRTITDDVGIGNTVVVQYADEPDPETFTILGPDDGKTKPGWISCETPLAKSLLGRKPGDRVTLPNGMKVALKQVLPGNF